MIGSDVKSKISNSLGELDFDSKLRDELGIYVYALIDPRPEFKGIFYIGKAGGKGEGNKRIKQHIEEAAKAIELRAEIGHTVLSPKIERFLDIWLAGYEIDWAIIRRKITTQEEAFSLEGALIDAFSKLDSQKLINRQGGHNSGSHGFIGREAVLGLSAQKFDALAAPDIVAGRNIFLFNIKNSLKGALNPNDDDFFKATHASWSIGQRWLNANGSIAVGLIDGISFGVYGIDRWYLNEGDENKSGKYRKWKFSKSPIEQSVKKSLHRKNFNEVLKQCGNWGRGGRVIFRISQIKSLEIVCGKLK